MLLHFLEYVRYFERWHLVLRMSSKNNNTSDYGNGFFNADSFRDLAVANDLSDDVSIRPGNGDGTFTTTAPDVPVGNAPTSIAVGDFDNN